MGAFTNFAPGPGLAPGPAWRQIKWRPPHIGTRGRRAGGAAGARCRRPARAARGQTEMPGPRPTFPFNPLGGENGFNQAIELSADTLANVKFVQEKR